MSPNDIKRIVNCVVDYGWPWQVLTHLETTISGSISNFTPYYTAQKSQSLHALFLALCWEVNRTEYLGYSFVRLDPNHVWDWPIEKREGIPVWGHLCVHAFEPFGNWERFDSLEHLRLYTAQFNYQCHYEVAPHPLNPTVEPPADWSPEGKRILK